ncbi:alpha/beta hydrolase [uncultured Marivita sp.]|uniref:alpha/beta fold hydrolase n=1 Tax=uncultured Marivita sp. TaxID=888080 RepID=UPI002635708A|nr:alpha/beta hydrolase [uncultured Marivita sp.]
MQDGAGIACRRAGRGAPVLMLHSLFFDGTMFDAVMPQGYDIIRPDHRGQGQSSLGDARPTAERLAADMDTLLDALKIRCPVHVVGSSMGAYVALEMLAANPGRVASLTLSCCTCRAEPEPGRFAKLADRIAAAQGRGLGAEIAALMFAEGFRGSARSRWQAHFDALPPATPQVVRAIFAHRGWVELIRGWGGPILAISGARDRAKSPADLAWIADERLGRHIVIPEAGHSPAVETTAAFAATLHPFLAEKANA